MKHTLIISLFLISVFSISYGQGSGIKNDKFNITNPDKKIGGCNNPKFKAAELAAYQDLLKARAEAAKVLEAEITNIEQAKKDQLAKENLKYLADLKTCGNDPQCPGAKKVDYDDGVWIIQAFAKSELLKAQNKEIAAKEAAQKKYDEEVIEAERLYCPSYQASGQDGPIVYSGTICSLEKSFTITGTHPMLVYHFNFVPSDGTSGTLSFSETVGSVILSGGGTYIIEELGAGKSRIIAQTHTTAKAPGGGGSGSGPAHIDLTPLPAKCSGQ